MTGVMGVSADAGVEAEGGQTGLEEARVAPQTLDALRLRLEDVDGGQAGGRHGRRLGGREQERSRALDEVVAQVLPAGDVAAQDARRPWTSVPTWMSTRPWRSKWSTVPRPLRPRTPEAWASSTITMAP